LIAADRWFTELDGRLLHARVDFGVPNGGVQADVAEPTANHIDVDARFEEMDRGGVSIMASFP
jgi:hypothetical protein